MGDVVGFCLKEPIPIAVIFEGLSTWPAEEPLESNDATPPDGDLIERVVVTDGDGGPLVLLVPSLAVASGLKVGLNNWLIVQMEGWILIVDMGSHLQWIH